MRTLPIASVVVTLGLLAAGCSRESVAPSAPAANIAGATASTVALEGWRYVTYTDKMTAETTSLAWVESNNTVELKFPYEGIQHGQLTVKERDGVQFEVEKGQIDCRESCLVLVKFDDAKATEYRWYALRDGRSWIYAYDKEMFARLKRAKKMAIRVFFYQSGFRDFEFTVEGLKPLPKPEKKPA